jgi:hypothetical protein
MRSTADQLTLNSGTLRQGPWLDRQYLCNQTANFQMAATTVGVN